MFLGQGSVTQQCSTQSVFIMINSAAAAALSAGIPFKETDKKSTRYNKADTAVIISVVR